MSFLKTTAIQHLNGAGTNINLNTNGDANFSANVTVNTRIGIGTTTPATSLDLSSVTDGILLPKGTDGQRPSGQNGLIRFNTTSGRVEHYFNSAWADNINKAGDFAWKEGNSSYNAAYKFNWAKGGRRGTSLDASTYGYGILVVESGYYDCEAWWRGPNGGMIGIAIDTDRGALEGADSNGLWGHDHTPGGGKWTNSRYIGYLAAGSLITAGNPSNSGDYSSEGYQAGLIITRMI